jgi:4-oxalocrotonate tautomerase
MRFENQATGLDPALLTCSTELSAMEAFFAPGSHGTEEVFMPLIQVKLIEGAFTEAQKREMARKLRDAMSSIDGENMRPVTWVTIHEVKGGDWGTVSKASTAPKVEELAAGKSTGCGAELTVAPGRCT